MVGRKRIIKFTSCTDTAIRNEQTENYYNITVLYRSFVGPEIHVMIIRIPDS